LCIVRTYQLAAETLEEKEKWIRELNIILKARDAPGQAAAPADATPAASSVAPPPRSNSTTTTTTPPSNIQIGTRQSVGSTSAPTTTTPTTAQPPASSAPVATNNSTPPAAADSVPLVQFQAILGQLCTVEFFFFLYPKPLFIVTLCALQLRLMQTTKS